MRHTRRWRNCGYGEKLYWLDTLKRVKETGNDMGNKATKVEREEAFVRGWPRKLACALLYIAMATAAYLLYNSLKGGGVAGCAPNSGCDEVLRSPYAYFLGIPVSLPALAAYIALIYFVRVAARNDSVELRRKAWRWMMGIAILISGAAFWLVMVQLVIIQKICPFCMLAHTCGLAASLLILFHAPIQPEPSIPWQREKKIYILPEAAKQITAIASCLLVLLVLGQLVFKKKGHIVKTLPAAAVITPSPSSQPASMTNRLLSSATTQPRTNTAAAISNRMSQISQVASSSPPATSPTRITSNTQPQPQVQNPGVPKAEAVRQGRVMSLYGGAVELDINQLPLWGSPEAPYVLVSLFDYTCHHCHQMHGYLVQLWQTFGNKVAVLSLPMPLDSQCNPAIQRTPRAHQNACQYAKLGLAVWRADRTKLKAFDDLMFAQLAPPPIEQARSAAEQLVGADALNKALGDPWIDDALSKSIKLFQSNSVTFNNGSMPQVVIGSQVVFGAINGVDDLYKVAEGALGLKKP